MDSRKTGDLIAKIRKDKNMTQKQFAEILGVSDKAISKWETGNGCPDIALLQQLSTILQVDISSLLEGRMNSNVKSNGNMKKTRFYVCPICDNVVTSINAISLSCCGKSLTTLVATKEEDGHQVKTEMVEDELYVTMPHEMSKNHYIGFVAYTTGDKLYFNKVYPEQNIEIRFKWRGHGFLYWYCVQHGLFTKTI